MSMTEIQLLRDDVRRLQSQLKNYEQGYMGVPNGKATLDRLKEENDTLRNEVVDLKYKLSEANERAADAKNDYDELLEMHEKEVNELRNELNKLDLNPFVKVLYSSGFLDKSVGGRNRLYKWMREIGIFMKSKVYWNEPYQEYFDRKWFEYQEKTLTNGKTVYVPIITSHGCSSIVELLRKNGLWHTNMTYEETKKYCESKEETK